MQFHNRCFCIGAPVEPDNLGRELYARSRADATGLRHAEICMANGSKISQAHLLSHYAVQTFLHEENNMRTTLNINDRLLTEAKALAARQRTTLTRLIEEGLRLRLRATASRTGPVKIELPTFKGGGFPPGIDPLSNRSLLGEDDDK
jgi:hypothetical protein